MIYNYNQKVWQISKGHQYEAKIQKSIIHITKAHKKKKDRNFLRSHDAICNPQLHLMSSKDSQKVLDQSPLEKKQRNKDNVNF